MVINYIGVGYLFLINLHLRMYLLLQVVWKAEVYKPDGVPVGADKEG